MDTPSAESLARLWLAAGRDPGEVRRAFHSFNTGAPAFLAAGNAAGAAEEKPHG
jgi:hypothetical protein